MNIIREIRLLTITDGGKNFKHLIILKIQLNMVLYLGTLSDNFLNQIQYILNQTGINGAAVTSEKLLTKVDAVLDTNMPYSLCDFLNDLGCNGLV